MQVAESEKSIKIIEGLSLMLKALDFEIIAEGIETQSQHFLCKELNINFMQGFLFSKAIPAENIEQLLIDCCLSQ